MNRSALLPSLLAAALAACAALPAAAQSADFRNWSAYGDVLAAATGATLSTAAVDSGETPTSGTSAWIYHDLEAALHTGFDADTYEGSAVDTRFQAAAGTRVDLNWAFGTVGFDVAFADRVYVLIDDGAPVALVDSDGSAQAGSFSHTFATGGAHRLGFAVLDVNDTAGVSTLTLSGLAVTAVPEPSTAALWLAGAALLVSAARRRR